jgi:hypothetical protein
VRDESVRPTRATTAMVVAHMHVSVVEDARGLKAVDVQAAATPRTLTRHAFTGGESSSALTSSPTRMGLEM